MADLRKKIYFGIFSAFMAIGGTWVCGYAASIYDKGWVDVCAGISGGIWIVCWIVIAIAYSSEKTY